MVIRSNGTLWMDEEQGVREVRLMRLARMSFKFFQQHVQGNREDSYTKTFEFKLHFGDIVYTLFLGDYTEGCFSITEEFTPFVSWILPSSPPGRLSCRTALGAWRMEEYNPKYQFISKPIIPINSLGDAFQYITAAYWALHQTRLESILVDEINS